MKTLTRREAVLAFTEGKKVNGFDRVRQTEFPVIKYEDFDRCEEFRLDGPDEDVTGKMVAAAKGRGFQYRNPGWTVWHECELYPDFDWEQISGRELRRKPGFNHDEVTGKMVTAANGKGFQFRHPSWQNWQDCGERIGDWPTDGYYQYRRKPEGQPVDIEGVAVCALWVRRLRDGGAIVLGRLDSCPLPDGVNDAVVRTTASFDRFRDETKSGKGKSWISILENGWKGI